MRGYWEAKDTQDHLEAELKKKIAKKYPLSNTIFEDTQSAMLYQKGRTPRKFDLTNPQEVADLLNEFYTFAEPDIQGFEEAVNGFKERVPELATGLSAKIQEAHEKNKKFQAAFDSFFSLCQTALNPNPGAPGPRRRGRDARPAPVDRTAVPQDLSRRRVHPAERHRQRGRYCR